MTFCITESLSPCGYSGILEGDEILSVNNIDIENAEDDIVDLQNALAGIPLFHHS